MQIFVKEYLQNRKGRVTITPTIYCWRKVRFCGNDSEFRGAATRAFHALPPDTRDYFFSQKEIAPYGTPKKRLWIFAKLRLRCPRMAVGQSLAAFSPPNMLGHPHNDTLAATRPLALLQCVSECYANKLSAYCRNSGSGDRRGQGIDDCPREAVDDCCQRQVRTKPFSFGCPEGYFLFGKRKYLFGKAAPLWEHLKKGFREKKIPLVSGGSARSARVRFRAAARNSFTKYGKLS